MPTTRRLRMFPLGSVLFPYGLLPLRIFEPRYLGMIEECLAEDREFGVVLIERGFEVGGGDQRFDVGTVALILEVMDLEDGHRAVVAAGRRRLRVAEWLPDDPYPQAVVADVDEPKPGRGAADLVGVADRRLHRVLALYSELGHDVGDVAFRLDDDPTAASFQAGTLAPIGPLDAQRLLESESAESRLELLVAMLDEEAAVLEQRLAGA